MGQIKFDVGNAMMHFTRTGGQPGFLWKFSLAYAVAAVLIGVVTSFFMWPIMAASLNPVTAQDPDAMAELMMESIGSVLLGYLLAFLLGILFWTVFEAASQRRYMRGEGLHFRLGADEARLLAVGFLWFVAFIALYIGSILLLMIPTILLGLAVNDGNGSGAGLAAIFAFLSGIGLMVLVIWICARLSPASAMTIRDQRIRFFEAWRITKGRVWTLVGSWLLLWLIAVVVFVVMYMVLIGILLAMFLPAMSGDFDEAQFFAAATAPGSIAVLVVVGILYYAAMGAFMHVFGGPAALAAKTDPAWAGGVTETFV